MSRKWTVKGIEIWALAICTAIIMMVIWGAREIILGVFGNNIRGVQDIKCAGKAVGGPKVDSIHHRVG